MLAFHANFDDDCGDGGGDGDYDDDDDDDTQCSVWMCKLCLRSNLVEVTKQNVD